MSSSSSEVADPRWLQLSGPGADCSCGEHHIGFVDLTFLKPPAWPGAVEYEEDEALRMDGNFLSHNYCVIDGRYFALRMILVLPVKGISPPASPMAIWASVDRSDFERFVANPRKPLADPPEQFLARLITRIGGYENTQGLYGMAFPMDDSPPLLVLMHPDDKLAHRLVVDHREGVTFDRLLEIYAAQNHDMRSSFAG